MQLEQEFGLNINCEPYPKGGDMVRGPISQMQKGQKGKGKTNKLMHL